MVQRVALLACWSKLQVKLILQIDRKLPVLHARLVGDVTLILIPEWLVSLGALIQVSKSAVGPTLNKGVWLQEC